jgi:GTP cyclohydrolase I
MMRDIQRSKDDRGIAIPSVGVKDVRYPISVPTKSGVLQPSVGVFWLFVNLSHDVRGTHMSRFIEVLNDHREGLESVRLQHMAKELVRKLEATRGTVSVRFPYFVEKEAPVSKKRSYLDYDCAYTAEFDADGDSCRVLLEVCAPVKSLCPCSKEISERGAHNQRSRVTMTVDPRAPITIEELIEVGESEASSALYALLKREDEKFVTEYAYDKPVFVEDLVRGVATRLEADPRIGWYRVESENFESIHNHNAFAMVESGQR